MPHGENRRGVQQGRTQRESLAGGGRINMMYVPFFNNCIGLDEYKFHQIEKKVHRIMK